MEIKIITLHSLFNPGSAFQAFALQHYLSKNGDVQIIDYRPAYSRYGGSFFKAFIKKLLYFRLRKNQSEKFEAFMKNYMNLTKTFYTYKSLCKANLKADLFVTGSDQLWNTDYPCGKDNAFYLDFVKNVKKISYSTSVGKKHIEEENLKKIKSFSDDFSSIAVREKDTAVQLGEKLKRNVEWVCDPVFLLDRDVYDSMIAQKPMFDKPYAFVYLSPKSPMLDTLIKYYRFKGLMIVLGGGYNKSRCDCDVHLKDMGPIDFLNCIKFAKVIISTSFHATAFCHIFHKDFITILPPKNGERVVSLLEQTNLMSRSLIERVDFDAIQKPIDWDDVDRKLSEYTDVSKDYLDRVLNFNKRMM
ncbi:polysaccharide pyruvyl transferase family protein [uncultured Fibrobacter sp.]|uniref:polysaccharide pyruvyl transferase family protein n=1 Tax=uncultured Fibrobacter sp. TaxID=261512 RepID=UPI0025F2585D|nr:polysaccharide pyruvyl transferase family protein [uncultured Fibrobacter sp.]